MNPVVSKVAREADFYNATMAKTVVTKDAASALKFIESIGDEQVRGRTVKNCVRKLSKWGDKTDKQQEYSTAVTWLNSANPITEAKTRIKVFTALKIWFSSMDNPYIPGKIQYIEEKCPEVKEMAQDPHNSLLMIHEIKALLEASKFDEALLKVGDVRKPDCRNWAHAELASRSTAHRHVWLDSSMTSPKIFDALKTEDPYERTKKLKRLIISFTCQMMPDLATKVARIMPPSDQRDHALDIAACIAASYDTDGANNLASLICIADRRQESEVRLANVFKANETQSNPYEFPKN